MTRVRIPINTDFSWMRVWLMVAAMLLFAAIACPDANGADVALLAYVGEGATTTPVILNPTDHDVTYPDTVTCSPIGGCQTVKGVTIKAGELRRFDHVTPANGIAGAYHVELPDPGLVAYSEIITGNSALVRCGPLAPSWRVRYLDLSAPGRYNSWLIIIPADGSLSIGGTTVQRDDGILIAGPADGRVTLQTQVVTGQAQNFYAVAGINDPVTGSQQLIEPR